MTQITVYGCGYVGLVVSACLAEAGFEVHSVERDADRLRQLNSEEPPADSPELEQLIARNKQVERLHFADHAPKNEAGIVFVCVGTPSSADGSSDMSSIYAVIDEVAATASRDTFIFIKSTVPPGTCVELQSRINATSPAHRIEVISNPEFLREGSAVNDFIRPARVIIGIQSPEAESCARFVYEKLLGDCDLLKIVEPPATAELSKYTSNMLLAARLAAINEAALIAERCGADITDVQSIAGADPRIGNDYLSAGCGFGGPCLVKDVQALDFFSKSYLESGFFRAILAANRQHQLHALSHLRAFFDGRLAGLKGAIWGLAFKQGTNDMRDASARLIIDALAQEGVSLRAFDPGIRQNCKYTDKLIPADTVLADSALDAAKDADFVIVCTAWPEFSEIQPEELRQIMSQAVIIDACNTLRAEDWIGADFHYKGMGTTPL